MLNNLSIRTLVDDLGTHLRLCSPPGGDRDFMHTVALLGQVNITRGNTLGGEDYGAKVVRGYIASQGASYTIPHRECADVVRHVNRRA